MPGYCKEFKIDIISYDLQAENDTRKTEIHGLKDILVRENECRARETDELR